MRVLQKLVVPCSVTILVVLALLGFPSFLPTPALAQGSTSPFQYQPFPSNPPPATPWRDFLPDPRDPKLHMTDGYTPGYLMTTNSGGLDKVAAGDAYKIAFSNAAAHAFVCRDSLGFDMYEVGVVMFFPGPCTITLHADLELADTTVPTCPKPGTEICTGAAITYSITPPAGGAWGTVWLPVECDCVDFDAIYLFGVFIDAVSCPGAAIVLSSSGPLPCKNYYNNGTGWADMLVLDPTLPGNLMIFGNAVCCNDVVPDGASTWGALKQRYDSQP